MRAGLTAIGAAGLMLAGCGGGGSASTATPVAATAANPAVLTAALYVDQAASAALYAIEAAKLAQARSSDADILRLARVQEQSSEGISGQLRFAGPRVNAVPDNELTPRHRAMLDALRSAADFDRVYLEQQEELIPQMRRFHEDYAVRGGSATLRPVATFSAEKMAEQAEALDRAK